MFVVIDNQYHDIFGPFPSDFLAKHWARENLTRIRIVEGEGEELPEIHWEVRPLIKPEPWGLSGSV